MVQTDGAEAMTIQRDYRSSKHVFTELLAVWPAQVIPPPATHPSYSYTTASISNCITQEAILSAWALVLRSLTASENVDFEVILEAGFDDQPDATVRFPFSVQLPADEGHGPDQVRALVGDTLRQARSLQRTSTAADRQDILGRNLGCQRGTSISISSSDPTTQHVTLDEHVENTRFPIHVSFQPSESVTNFVVAFRSDLHTHEYADEIVRQVLQTVAWLGGRQGPFAPFVNLDLILSWTQPCQVISSEPLLHTAIEEQCRMTPNTIAIGQSENVMTYSELNLSASLLSDEIIASRPSPGKSVHNAGVFFEKSPFAIVSMLAILKAGGTYVPLDIAWPLQRILEIVKNASIDTVLSSRAQAARLRDQPVRAMVVDEQSVYALKQKKKRENPPKDESLDGSWKRPTVSSSAAAYMLYTSGSTGTPKGIPVSHAAISTALQAIAKQLGISSSTRTFQYTTFTFDLNIADIWMTLSQGGRICLPTEDERLDPAQFIAQERCNYAMITPTAAAAFDTATLQQHIQTLALIGEAVPGRLLRKLLTCDGPSSLDVYNTWGPTEACVIASSSKKHSLINNNKNNSSSNGGGNAGPSALALHPNDIGTAVGCSMFLVSPTDPHRLAPVFAPGEIALVGNTLANGYYDNESKTAEAFRTDLAWTTSEAIIARVFGGDGATPDKIPMVYLTGDIGRFNPNGDGSVIFMHRKDGSYVKINGYRVDPGEVESRVSEAGLSGAADGGGGICVVDYQPSRPGRSGEDVDTEQQQRQSSGDNSSSTRKTLVCFFIPPHHARRGGGGGGSSSRQRDHSANLSSSSDCDTICSCRLSQQAHHTIRSVTERLRETLPEYMVPELFVGVGRIPVLTSHKIDRRRLREWLSELEDRSGGWEKVVMRTRMGLGDAEG